MLYAHQSVWVGHKKLKILLAKIAINSNNNGYHIHNIFMTLHFAYKHNTLTCTYEHSNKILRYTLYVESN